MAAQGKDTPKNIKGKAAKVVKQDAGFQIIGKTSKKVLKNQEKGVTDIKDQEDREGGATRTNRSGK